MIKDRVKSLRESHNLSRKEFAALLDCSMSHVINLETGAARLSEAFVGIMEKRFDLPDNYFGPLDDDPPDVTTDYDVTIGKNVQYYRKRSHMTQQILAEEMGYSQASSVSAIERGKKPIGKKKLIELAGIFNIHVSELFSSKESLEATEDDALLNKFVYLLKSKSRPTVFEAIRELIESGCKELRDKGPQL